MVSDKTILKEIADEAIKIYNDYPVSALTAFKMAEKIVKEKHQNYEVMEEEV